MVLRTDPQANKPPTDHSRESRLLLLFGSVEGTSSPEANETEFELVPTVVQRRHLQATRKFIERSSSSSRDSDSQSPILLAQGVASKRIELPASSDNRQKPASIPISTPLEVLPPTVYIPERTVASMASRNKEQQKPYQGTSYAQSIRNTSGILPSPSFESKY